MWPPLFKKHCFVLPNCRSHTWQKTRKRKQVAGLLRRRGKNSRWHFGPEQRFSPLHPKSRPEGHHPTRPSRPRTCFPSSVG